MKIAVVGTGYVGLVAGVCFADVGHRVTCVDNVEEKIAKLKAGEVPIYEPGLEEILANTKDRIEFTTDLEYAVDNNDVIFIAVGTPEKEDGSADLGPTMSVVKAICKAAQSDKVIVLKSTVPIGTGRSIRSFCREACEHEIAIVNNPEFLKEGAAIDDFLRPDRVVVGCETQKSRDLMAELYDPFIRNGHPIYFMDNTSAEMTKYAANAFLSVKISFANELARLADEVGADIDKVRKGFTSDSRISPAFFYPGVGYGGSCFPKDVMALIRTGEENGVPMEIVKSADAVNDRQKTYLFDLVTKEYGSDLSGMTFCLWGLAFKPRTDDVREAPSQYLMKKLVAAGAKIRAYDPAAMKTAKKAFDVEFDVFESALEASKGCDALLLVTEWNEFANPNLRELKENLKAPVIFDGRNIYDPQKMMDLGFKYFSVGRQVLTRNQDSHKSNDH